MQTGSAFCDGDIMPVFCPTEQQSDGVFTDCAQAIEMTGPGYCAWGCFSVFVLIGAPYSHAHVEKSFSYCGTSFQTPFSFLLVMVISCGWYR